MSDEMMGIWRAGRGASERRTLLHVRWRRCGPVKRL